ncbi:MAG TPA: PilZ domain-containing protein [Syntrophomonadaceae bacterium]|nr:PilZ domain-containing protein [Syntrophomonadaceae bacterium]
MNFHDNQKIKIINEQNEYFACIDVVNSNDMSITVYDAVDVFNPGETIVIEATGNDAVYLCQTTVLKAVSGARNSNCVLSIPDTFSRVQRREYIRFPSHIVVQFREPENETWSRGLTQDISGNGLKLSSKIPQQMGSLLELSFTLKTKTSTHSIKNMGQVVREYKAVKGYTYGILFVDMPPAERDKVVKYILYESVKKRSLTSFLTGP